MALFPFGDPAGSTGSERKSAAGGPGQVEVLQPSVGDEPLTGFGPDLGTELEHAVDGERGDDREDFLQVQLGIEPVQFGGRHERRDCAGAVGVLFAAVEQPVDSPFDVTPELVLGGAMPRPGLCRVGG